MKQYQILIIYDVHVDTDEGRLMWAYGRRAEALQKYAPEDMSIDICQTLDTPWNSIGEYDLVFNMEYLAPNRQRFKRSAPNVPLVGSYNSDSNRRLERWPKPHQEFDFLIVNNMDMFEYQGRPQKTCCISNGVDTDVFQQTVPIAEREHRILWYGSSNPKKGKGWQELIEPAQKELESRGFICDFTPIDNITAGTVLPVQGLVEKYNTASYILCASRSEGTPNSSLEGMACGCVLVSTQVGNALEFGQQNENMVFIDRSVESLIAGLECARHHRERLSEAGRNTMNLKWSYSAPGHRVEYYYQLWRRIINDGPESILPFSYDAIDWSDI